MIKREVSIITGWGDHLGSGHIQRMANLASHINVHTSLQAFLICEQKPAFLPESFNDIVSKTIRPGSSFMIRDRRDSSIGEMKELERYGRVIAIDDCGPGRDLADLPIDLLPNLTYSIAKKELFIYGFTFADSIKNLGASPVHKDLDYAIYCGISPSRRTIDTILSLIPTQCSCAILTGDDSTLLKDGIIMPLHKTYAEALLSARVLITHFGITLYEGYIAGCRLITMNPTEYHSRLSDIAKDDLGLINLGIIDAFDPDHARSSIYKTLLNAETGSINPSFISEIIQNGCGMFLSRIQSFM
jgi:hypothetical protein